MAPVPPMLVVAAAGRRRTRLAAAGCLALVGAPALPMLFGLALLGAVLNGVRGAGGVDTMTPAAVLVPAGIPMTCPALVVARGFQLPIHAGIDLDCPVGTPVRATVAGVVHRRQDFGGSCALGGTIHGGGYGTYAVLEPSGAAAVRQYFGHLAGYQVPDGSQVEAGAVIGYEGTTGCSTGPHLHFEVRVRGVPVNPCPYLNASYPSSVWRREGCPLHLR